MIRRAQDPTPLVLVIAGSVGALVGLIFIKSSPWFILLGAALGVVFVLLIGLWYGSPEPERSEFALNMGCCLAELLFYGCMGCVTMITAALGGLLLAISFVVR